MIKEHPILFSTNMVQAILEGRKTQTRRIVKIGKNIDDAKFGYTAFTPDRSISVRGLHGGIYGESFVKCPYGKRDILWVRETFQYVDIPDEYSGYVYKAHGGLDWEMSNDEWKWKPSIFMPKDACRIFLEITGIRVEMLQDISEEDAKAEGVKPFKKNYDDRDDCWSDNKHKTAYEYLWNTINGWSPNSWELNPFVWVIEFIRIEK